MFNRNIKPSRITSMLIATGLAIAVSTSAASAQTPTDFTFQGVLTGPGGPVTTEVEIVFLLFDAPVNGNIQGDPIFVTLTPEDGLFSVELDFGAAAFAENQPLWLQLDVSDTSNPINNDSFRQPLTSAPFALNTRGMSVDANGNAAIDNRLTVLGSELFFPDFWDMGAEGNNSFMINETNVAPRLTIAQGGNVGIGTDTPSMLLDLGGFGLDKPTSNNRGLYSSSPNEFVQFSGNNATALSADVFLDLVTGGTARVEVRSAATTVTNDLIANQDLSVNGDVTTPDRVGIGAGAFSLMPSDDLAVVGRGRFLEALSVGFAPGQGNFNVFGSATLTGDISIADQLDVTANTTFRNDVVLAQQSDLSVTGNVNINGTGQLRAVDGPHRIGTVNAPFTALTIDTSTAFGLTISRGDAAKPGGSTWAFASDERLKKNIHTIDGALDTLLALRGVHYEYKDPNAIGELDGVRTGFIAQEAEKVIPDWVSDRDDGYKFMTIRGFEALSVEAMRELHAENASLRADIESLRAEVRESRSPFGASLLWPMIAVGGVGGLVVARRRTAQT
ncbi:MAG: tail fiber domain-containing protein [Phycisphaerales bacterium]|nr:tail fiber domain-containing protein [Phycisphaerales bacterium]